MLPASWSWLGLFSTLLKSLFVIEITDRHWNQYWSSSKSSSTSSLLVIDIIIGRHRCQHCSSLISSSAAIVVKDIILDCLMLHLTNFYFDFRCGERESGNWLCGDREWCHRQIWTPRVDEFSDVHSSARDFFGVRICSFQSSFKPQSKCQRVVVDMKAPKIEAAKHLPPGGLSHWAQYHCCSYLLHM